MPQRAMEKLGLLRDMDLVLHVPLRYEDETQLHRFDALREGLLAQVQGRVVDSRVEFRHRKQLLVRLTPLDASDRGDLTLRYLNFYPALQKTLSVGALLRVRGEVRGGFLGLEMVHPTHKLVEGDEALPQTLTPVYPTTAALPQAYLRKAIAGALQRADLSELLPREVFDAPAARHWPSLREAVRFVHQPPAETKLDALAERAAPAWQRLKFEELLAQQLSALRARRERERLRAPPLITMAGGLNQGLRQALPFALTAAQMRVCAEIEHDLALAQPMHRLLQGDVGSGKTVIAALAATLAIDAGWQCALMAPTEILAEQHFKKLVDWLAPLGVRVAWLTGSMRAAERRASLERTASGEAQLIIGTHAVIQEQVEFARLGLAIIDEQHRFGVAQRLALRNKALASQAGAQPGQLLEPHVLMMSATPIPRTLAMAYYADLEVSTIDELPPGRTPIETRVFADDKREQVMQRIRQAVQQGRQVYWVCPLIEESEEAPEPVEAPGRGPAQRALRNVIATHADLLHALPDCRIGLVHGRLKAAEKAAVMQAFAAGEIDVLVATTVIEVGVDVPNASLMVVEHAERYGLSQLHQLRGRVGRGAHASTCVLLYTPPLSDAGKARLKTMAQTQDGFEIARRDLELRGPGEFLGARQSGVHMLRFADALIDAGLLQQARTAAARLLDEQPELAERHVRRWLGQRTDYLKA